MQQERAPLFEALLAHVQHSQVNGHVPGHKQGMAYDQQGKEWFHPLLQLDLTEVGELDDMHHPEGVIASAQELAATAFGADHTRFLVGGTTVGNLATVLYLCHPGDTVIMQRHSHQSLFHGCLLAGAQPVYLDTKIDQQGREQPIEVEQLRSLLEKHPYAKGVWITSPSYFGMVQPVQEIAQICHQWNIPLIVDEAHGAHFGFHPQLPRPAIQLGADISIQSTHKMLPSMTMSSMLHVRGERIQVDELARWLRMIQSSSPSYPLMASLDLARRYMVQQGEAQLQQVLTLLQHLRERIVTFTHIYEMRMEERWRAEQDPFKLTLCATGKMTGYQLAEWLEQQGIYPELADHQRVLFAFSVGTSEAEIHILGDQLAKLDQEIASLPKLIGNTFPVFPDYTHPLRTFAEIRKGTRISIPLSASEGRISTEAIVPYPPGIPLLLPGEAFSCEAIQYLSAILVAGGKVRGIQQPSSPTVFVLQ